MKALDLIKALRDVPDWSSRRCDMLSKYVTSCVLKHFPHYGIRYALLPGVVFSPTRLAKISLAAGEIVQRTHVLVTASCDVPHLGSVIHIFSF